MTKFTKKEYKQEFKEIQKYFDLPFLGSIDNKNSINTEWGKYNFYFDNDSIFGKFENLKIDKLPPKNQICSGIVYTLEFYPNIYTGKMNFHFYQIFDFISTIDRILK